MESLTLVFVHGYSVSNLNTYGELPQVLKLEAAKHGFSLNIQDVFLGRYISFNDEIKLSDIAKAMQAAVQSQIPKNTHFACITHSTGAPVVRTWLHLYYQNASFCPLSHLIMLAPANHGSALAQLGKSRLSRIKTWLEGVEPGQNILNWLELGSEEAWYLNINWIKNEAKNLLNNAIFPFVLSGQDIDRKLYDHLNSYTGEAGSDGVVRLASANLNSTYIKLEQSTPKLMNGVTASVLVLTEYLNSPNIVFQILRKKSHSGDTMGILKSIKKENSDTTNKETIESIFECLRVKSIHDYFSICDTFHQKSTEVQKESLLEVQQNLFQQNYFIHDRYSMLIIKVCDMDSNPITDFDVILTAGDESDPNALASGFLCDRQANRLNKSYLTFYFNYDKMVGVEALTHQGELIRKASYGMKSIGIRVQARPEKGFVRFASTEISASEELLHKLIKPNACTLVEIRLQRLISNQVFQFEKSKSDDPFVLDFKKTSAGNDFIV